MKKTGTLPDFTHKLREDGSIRIAERARVLEAASDGKNGEKIFKVILISEGLGNRRNMNYYGPEAISSAVKAFEGRFCYLNHNSVSGEHDLPERDVRDKAGYYKNLQESTVDGQHCVVGELHCDMSESGKILAEKMASALHYKEDVPNSPYEYVGLSVNGDGDAERRTMDIDGNKEDVNYVKEFTEGDSCDCVTTPARGGRSLAVLREDENGVSIIKPEDNMKLLKKLKAALANVNESLKKATGELKSQLQEAQKELRSSIRVIEDEGGEDEAEAYCAKREGESEADHKARLAKMGDAISKAIGSKSDDDAEDEDEGEGEGEDEGETESEGEDEGDANMESGRKPRRESRKPAVLSADDLRRNKIAIRHLMLESGIPEKAYSEGKIDRLARMPFKAAESIIKDDAQFGQALLESADIPVASLRGGARESRDSSANSVFKEAYRK